MLRRSYVCFVVAIILIASIYFILIPFTAFIPLIILMFGTYFGYKAWKRDKGAKSLIPLLLNGITLILLFIPLSFLSVFINS